MMILSGAPSLVEYIQSHEQLDELVDPVHFTAIKIRRDQEQLTEFLFAFAVHLAGLFGSV